ncbi:MAG: tetratricopeptide repeat protein [Pseudomonadota bacterium]
MATVNLLTPSGLFAYTGPQTANLEAQATNAVNYGISLFTNGDYEGAIREYKRAVALAPNSSLAVDAYNSMGQAYTQNGQNDEAIKAYQEALRRDPNRSDIRISLGNIHFYNNDYDAAVAQYEEAVRVDPGSANRFSLAQGYLAQGNLTEAEFQFSRVRDMAPDEPSGHYGLGQLYAKQGDKERAIEEFRAAIDVQWDFWDAYVELGYALVDTGETAEAESLATYIYDFDATKSATLFEYIDQQKPATMSLALSGGSFVSTLGPGTPVSFLGNYTPDSSQTLSMVFQFDKPMDASSVQDITNWTISRSTNTGLGDGYNYGLPVPETEATLAPHPLAVYYNPSDYTATVYFSINQNADISATIDPSHIQFTFSGVDGYGISVDPATDQYAGFSGFA